MGGACCANQTTPSNNLSTEAEVLRHHAITNKAKGEYLCGLARFGRGSCLAEVLITVWTLSVKV